MIGFLEVIREQNPGKLCIVMDNDSMQMLKQEQRNLIYISSIFHLTHLNPIEFGWKDLKRELGSILDFDDMIERSEEIALDIFGKRKYSYSESWVEEFISIRSC